ncbi:MAG: SDR family NAD(P)-dependent oxidoreductase [Alphaproteobacteria bacterium]|nr:SDR family NAD(P)-dependent oxidoreductase [Alphaproteobacteria bacterium]
MAVYLVTGAGSGIGLAVAEAARAKGHRVCLFDLSFPEGRQPDADAIYFEGDVTDLRSCQNAAEQAVRTFGQLDGLSHNAGIQRYGSVQDTDNETWDEIISVNLTGGFNIAKATLPELRKSRGSLVFMGSVQSIATQQNVAAYTAAKHGLLGLARSIAMDFAGDGVRSNVVAPGAVKTPMLDWAVSLADDPDALWSVLHGMHPLGRIATAIEVANVVMFLLSDEASFVTGEIVRVDGGLLSQIAGTPRGVER